MKFKILFFLILLLLSGVSSLSLFEEEWKYHTGAIREIFFEDLDSDGYQEIVSWAGDTIVALDLDGSKLWGFSKEDVLSVDVVDLDDNGRKETVVTSGRSIGGTDRSFLWILDNDGKVILKYPASQVALTILLKSVRALDLDNNKYKEIIVGTSGGVCVFNDEYSEILWHNRDELEEHIEKLVIGNIVGDVNEEILAQANTGVYLVNYDGGVEWGYPIYEGIKEIKLGNIYQIDRQEVVVLSSKELFILDGKGNLSKKTETPEGAESLFVENLDVDFADEIILTAEKVIYLLDDDLKLKAEYSFSDEEEIRAVFLENFDLDSEEEIMVFTNKKLYGFWKNLTLKFKFTLPYSAYRVFSLDSYSQKILLNSEGVTYSFQINENFWEEKRGDEFYQKALHYFNSSDYDNAKSYLNRAMENYQEAETLLGILKCRELSKKIESKEHGEKIKIAEDYYEKGVRFYNQSLYENATHYLNLAKKLFLEIKDVEGILTCQALLLKIKEMKTSTTLTSTTSIITTTTLEEKPQPDNSGKLILGFLILLLMVVLFIFILRKKWRRKS